MESVKVRLLLAATIGSAFAALYWLMLAMSFWRVFPYWDQWRAVLMYQAWTEQSVSLLQFVRDHIIAQHNEHRIPLTETAFLIDFSIFAGTSVFMFPLLMLSYLALALALGLTIGRGDELAAWVAISLAFILSPIQIDNLTLPFHLLWAWAGLFALAAFYCTARLSDEKASWRVTAAACAAVVLSVYNSANGIAAAFCVIVMTAVIARGTPRVITITVSAASILLYFVGYSAPETTKYHATLTTTTGIYYFGAYFLALVGGVAASLGLAASRFLGLFGLAVAALVWISVLQCKERLDTKTIALIALFSWSALSALMTAAGRGGIGSEQALWSRYGTMVMLFWLPLIGAIWRMTRNNRWSAACFPAALAVLALSALAGLPFIVEAKGRVAVIDKTTDDLLSGRPDTSGINRPDLIEFLKRRHLSIFVPTYRR